jgi:hypothetical protein
MGRRGKGVQPRAGEVTANQAAGWRYSIGLWALEQKE